MAWRYKGVWYEACAAEGHCSLWFGRDLEKPCTSFQMFQIDEGEINGVDIGGTLVMLLADLYSPKFVDLMSRGGEGGLYISDACNEKQGKELEAFFVNNVSGASLLRKILGVRHVKIEMEKKNGTYHFIMPYGEIEMGVDLLERHRGQGASLKRHTDSRDFGCALAPDGISSTHQNHRWNVGTESG